MAFSGRKCTSRLGRRVVERCAAMVPRCVALFALVAIAAADQVGDLSALVEAQGRLLEQMQQQLQSQTAAIEALELAQAVWPGREQGTEQGAEQGAEQGERSSAPGREGRQLTAAPASQRKTWHHSILHSFDDPSSCGLHAELHSDATGPMDITRSSDGNVTMGYGGTPSATQPGAFELNHPANCRTATLRINHPVTTTGDLAVGGALTGFAVQPTQYSGFDGSTGIPHDAVDTANNREDTDAGWSDWITTPLVLTRTSLVLLHYQVTVETAAGEFVATRLVKNDEKLNGTRSICGATNNQAYGTASGQWIGSVPAGTHSIKLNVRNSLAQEIVSYWETQALTVAILG